ncbi:Uncharacterised protein [BD1-7 clade bacterium]|uniref:Pyridoxamine 5'-phosphate oxidase putative domain-containing protein n=1 Tax=BD1-7 clade bacterium TaxID=2029982 RepID=A0A5S9QLM5_9GAMM|nr:Uncharacterised protein [BD1-7 clade bacterium]
MDQWNNTDYLSLSTRKKDGSHVDTPVWYAREDNTFYCFSAGNAGKVKRIRNFTDVKICPCTVTGKITGEWEGAEAEILTRDEIHLAHRALKRQYGWKMALMDILSTFGNKKAKRAYLRIRPTQ